MYSPTPNGFQPCKESQTGYTESRLEIPESNPSQPDNAGPWRTVGRLNEGEAYCLTRLRSKMAGCRCRLPIRSLFSRSFF